MVRQWLQAREGENEERTQRECEGKKGAQSRGTKKVRLQSKVVHDISKKVITVNC